MRIGFNILASSFLLLSVGCSKSSKDQTKSVTPSKERNTLQEYVHAPIDSAKGAKEKAAERDHEMTEQMDSMNDE
jgi:hypothetical protein